MSENLSNKNKRVEQIYSYLNYNMKKKIQKLLIKWFFKKPIRQYVDARIKGKDEDFTGYLHELLYKDEIRMVGSREGLQGYYDLDIEMNRQLQNEIQQYVRD